MNSKILASNPNFPTFICDDYKLHWQMTRIEKIFLYSFLQNLRPKISIEVGTYKGGSLQVISEFSEYVYSIDISQDCRNRLNNIFQNVEFLTGNSVDLLPKLMSTLYSSHKYPDFILVDADHSEKGVRNDINNILEHYKPYSELYIICHDSFNPSCRKGLLSVDYLNFPYVHFVEIDFIPGVYHFEAFDTAKPNSMWGGFALIKLLPYKRDFDLHIHQSQMGLFNAVLEYSKKWEK